MKAIILVAGQGTRLRPYTEQCPKALVELFGKPILAHQINALKQQGIDDISLVTGYQADQLQSYGHCYHNPLFEQTNMVYSLFQALDVLESGEDIIVSYGDIVCDQEVVEALVKAPHDISVVADKGWRDYWQRRMPNPLADAESFKLKADGSIRELGKKAQSYADIQAQYIGLFKLSANILPSVIAFYQSMDRAADYDGQGFDQMYMTSFLQALIDSGQRLSPVFVQRGWVEIDTTEDLDLCHQMGSLSQALA